MKPGVVGCMNAIVANAPCLMRLALPWSPQEMFRDQHDGYPPLDSSSIQVLEVIDPEDMYRFNISRISQYLKKFASIHTLELRGDSVFKFLWALAQSMDICPLLRCVVLYYDHELSADHLEGFLRKRCYQAGGQVCRMHLSAGMRILMHPGYLDLGRDEVDVSWEKFVELLQCRGLKPALSEQF